MRLLKILLLLCAAELSLHATEPNTPNAIERLNPPLQKFFAKRIYDGRLPILAHASVTDEGLLAARDHLHRLLAHAPKLRANLEAAKLEMHVIGLKQFASDLPEFQDGRGTRLENGELFDWHMVGGHITGRFLACTEGTLLPIVGHRLFGDETCYHELAHAIELLALDNATRARVERAYRRSIADGHWANQYAAKGENEWFAEITKYYFRAGGARLAFYDSRLARGHDWLRDEDPEAFQLVDDLYGGRSDPGTPRRVPLVLGPGAAEKTLKSGASKLPVRLTLHNRTAERIHLVWLDFEGRRDPRQPFADLPSAAPGHDLDEASWATHTFVVTDDRGAALCTLTAGAEDSEADVTGACR